MCKFSITCRIGLYECGVFLGEGTYDKFIAYPASFPIQVLIPQPNDVVEGDYIFSQEAELTHIKNYGTGKQEIAIVIHSYNVVKADSQVEEVDYVPVVVSGELVKTNKAHLQKIGKPKFDFIACSLKTTNEDMQSKNFLLAAFRREAREIDCLRNGASLKVYARLRRCYGYDDFELNVSSVQEEEISRKEETICATV